MDPELEKKIREYVLTEEDKAKLTPEEIALVEESLRQMVDHSIPVAPPTPEGWDDFTVPKKG